MDERLRGESRDAINRVSNAKSLKSFSDGAFGSIDICGAKPRIFNQRRNDPAHEEAEFAASAVGAENFQPLRNADLSANEYQEAVDVLAEGLQDDAVQTQVEKLLKPVLELVNNAETFEEVAAGVDSLFPRLDSSDISATLEKAILLGDTWGRLSNGGVQ